MNFERDSCVTGTGAVHLENYSFVHQVYGQLEAVEQVLRSLGGIGATIGFPKRFAVGCSAVLRRNQTKMRGLQRVVV